jgi:hypothetical protein
MHHFDSRVTVTAASSLSSSAFGRAIVYGGGFERTMSPGEHTVNRFPETAFSVENRDYADDQRISHRSSNSIVLLLGESK